MNHKRLLLVFSVAVIVFMVASCSARKAETADTIAYVRHLVADSTKSAFRLVSEYDESRTDGTIAVIGSPQECVYLSERFLTCDDFDNINGSRTPDQLPDFAGEKVAAILDLANSPYAGYLSAANENYLKEIAVRNSLSALDTACRISQFDHDKVILKSKAKAIVLASSFFSGYGYAEVDTLFSIAGKRIPLISPVHAMLDEAFSKYKGGVTIGVWAGKDVVASGIYSTVYKGMARQDKSLKASLIEFSPDSVSDAESGFLKFLDMYSYAGNSTRLSAVLLDDYGLQVDSLNAVLVKIRRGETDRMIYYSKLLSDDFSFISPAEAITRECYLIFRKDNRFTHNISYPQVECYETMPLPDLSSTAYKEDGFLTDKYKYSRADGTDKETYTLIELSGRHLPSEVVDFMRDHAPSIYKKYVSY